MGTSFLFFSPSLVHYHFQKENFLRSFPFFVDTLFLSYFDPRLVVSPHLWDVVKWLTRCFTFWFMEASRASGGRVGVGGAERVGYRNREVRGRWCGVQRGLHGGGPVGGESPPTFEELGESLPSPGRSQVLKPLTQPSSRSRTWSSMQPCLGLGSSSGLGSRTTSCSVGLSSTYRFCTYPLPVDLGLIIHKRL